MRRYLDQKLKVRQLRVLAAVAAQGSLLKASQSLGLSQPALTKSLREIEDLVGVRLFERHARGVEENAYGAILAQASRRVLDIIREAEEAIDRLDDKQDGSVVIGALPTAAAGVMPAVMHRLRTDWPGISIRVIEDRYEALMGALDVGDIDLVVGRLYTPVRPEANILRTELYDEPLSVIVGCDHPLAAGGAIDPGEIERFQVSLPIATFRIHEDTRDFLECYAIHADEGITTTSLTLLRELLASSTLVTVMPRLMLAGDILRGTLRAVPLIGGPPPPRPAGLLQRSDRPLTPPAQLVAQLIADHANEVLAKTAP